MQDAGVQGENAIYPATMLQGVFICGCIPACCGHLLYSLRNNIAEVRCSLRPPRSGGPGATYYRPGHSYSKFILLINLQ